MAIFDEDKKIQVQAHLLKYLAWSIIPIPYKLACVVLKQLGMSASQSHIFLSEMHEQKLVSISNNMRYWGDKECGLSPINLLNILWQIKEESQVEFSKYPQPDAGWIWSQVTNFREGLFYWAETGEYNEPIRQIEFKACPDVIKLLMAMPHCPQWLGFYSHMPDCLLTDLAQVRFREWLNDLKKPDLELIQRVYRDNKDLSPYVKEYVEENYAFYEYVLSGRIAEIPLNMSNYSIVGLLAHALYAQYGGDYTTAIKLYTQALKDQHNFFFFQNTIYVFTYILALVKEGSKVSRKKLETLSKKRDLREYSHYAASLLMVQISVGADTTEVCQWIAHNYDCQTNLNKVLIAIVMKHYELKIYNHNEVDQLIEETGYLLLQKLEDLFRPYRKMQEWEKALEQLDGLLGKDGTANRGFSSESVGRVVYHIDKDDRVIPRLQKSKDGIHWSKGRNIALFTFKQKILVEMTEVDKKVADCVRCYFGGNTINDFYDLSGAKVFSILAGYPFVYMEENPNIPIVITKEEPQLVVSIMDGGYRVTSNVEQPESGAEVLVKENDQLYRVIEMNPTQRIILSTFKKTPLFPEKAKSKLASLLGEIGKNVTVHSDLVQNKEELKRVDGDSLITVQLQPVGEGVKVELFVKPFTEQPPYCKAGAGAGSVIGTIEGKRVQAMRNMEKEMENLAVIQCILMEVSGEQMQTDIIYFNNYYECLELIERLQDQSSVSRVEWPEGAKLSIKSTANFSQLHLSLKGKGYWFNVDGELEVTEGANLKIVELLQKVRESKGRFIALGKSEFIALSKQLRQRLGELDAMMMNDKRLKISSFNASLLTDMEQLGVSLNKDKKFEELQKRIEESVNMPFNLPNTLQTELRSYQLEGFQWMSQLSYWGAGACLADDMGLGKTVQAIALMLSRAKQGASLIVVPASVLMNWQHEIHRFAPSLNCHILHDICGDREKMVLDVSDFDILLTTYGLLVSEEKLLASKQWNVILLDEAHAIKNRETKMSKAAMTLNGEFRLLLTGTPIQNHLSEIWSLFQFANPGLLGSFAQFNEMFILPIEKSGDKRQQKQLKKIIQPFLLRRTKAEVLDELPQKTEIVQQVELSQEEMALYESLRLQAICNLEEGFTSPIQTLAEITRLRQAACHPALVDSKLTLSSAKTGVFLELVEELIANKHRALVFSQFTSHLALIRKELDVRKMSYLYLDGSVTVNERGKLVHEFQQGEAPLFLISLKAGGTGLNLTAADYVIHLDPWWNPAVEDQASDRAYRIGQTRPVTIYRLISSNTIEERIVELHQSKKSLADSLLDGSNMAHKLTKEEMIQLLKGNI